MNIRQLQVAADAVQDRLLLRVATEGNEEIRVHLTRRFLKELWPPLATTLARNNAPQPSTAKAARAPGNFSEPFRNDDPTYPLGSTPLLAAEAKLDVQADGQCILTFREHKERSVALNLNGDLLPALCAMLRAGAEQCQWELALDYEAASAVPDAVSPPPKTLLH